MRTYNEYLTEVQHSQAFVKVSIGGVDVTSRLVRDMGLETDALLDTPELSVFTASDVVIYLTNHDSYFSAKQDPNFFTENSLTASGWRVPVLIQGGFVGLPARVFFYGEIEEVRQVPGKRFVRVLVLDLSTRLRHALVDDFGESVTRDLTGAEDAPNYSEVNPTYQLGVGDLPISRESLSARIGNEHLTVHPALPEGGASGDYRDIAVNLNTGILTFGGEPPNKQQTTLNLTFKTTYRYRAPEFLVYELAKAQGLYAGMSADESRFARTLLQSPTLKHSRNVVSSLGRPKSQTDKPLIRGITSDLSGVYLCGDRSLLQYERRGTLELDTTTLLGACPDTDATLLSVVKDGNNYYLLSSSSRSGLSSKVWRFDGMTWTELAGPTNGEPSTAFPYDYDSVLDLVADNRKGFTVHAGHLYFIFTDTGHGVRRINLSSGAIETVYTVPQSARHSADFIIHAERLYVFFAEGERDGASNFLRGYRMGLNGMSPTQILSEQIEAGDDRFYPATVSDIAVLDDNFYFVFSKHRGRLVSGVSELSRLPLTGGTRGVLKRYENMLFGPRSLVEYKRRIHFVEGQWISSFSNKTYPTFSDAGHIQSIDTHGMIVDGGGAWRSYHDKEMGTGFGMHTAFPSNLWHDNLTDSLFFIAGYGLPIDVDADNIRTLNKPIAQDLTNWVWLQYGQNLATRIAEFQTNGISTWELLSRLARTVDWEIGFTEAVEELKAFYVANPHIEAFAPKRYLFFRPRSVEQSDLVLDGSVNVQVGAGLDSTLVFNHIGVAYGDGYWIEKDPALIAGEVPSRYLPLNTGLLSAQDEPWAEILGCRYLERQRVPRQKVESLLKFAPQLELGQYLEITSKWNAFVEVPFQITQIEHFSDAWQTRIEGREIIVALEPLQFENPIEDVMFRVGDSISETLSAATGGLSPLSYTLTGLPTGLTFTEATRSYGGSVTEAGVYLATYKACDASDPVLSITGRFKIIIKGPDGVTPEPEPADAVIGDVWSGMALVGTKAIVLSNATDKIYRYAFPNTLEQTLGIGTGNWLDIATDGSRIYLLDGASVKTVPVEFGDTGSPTNLASLDASVEWMAITVSGGKAYILGKVSDATDDAPNPDFVVHVFTISSTALTAVAAENIDVKLDANYTGLAYRSPYLYLLIEDIGVAVAYDLTGSRAPGSAGRTIFPGSTGWVGFDYSTVAEREGFYALRDSSSRILALTDGGRREASNDYRL